MHILHQGRWLCDRSITGVPFTFTVTVEVEECELDELWEDVREEYFQRSSFLWVERCRQLLLEQAEPPGEVGDQMIRALASEKDPRESFFFRTHLFRDCDGHSHSLEGLYAIQQGGGTIAFISAGRPLPDDQSLLPAATILRVTKPEARGLLEQAPGLGARNFDIFLDDLRSAQDYLVKLPGPSQGAVHWKQGDYQGWLEVVPRGLEARVELVTRGMAVAPEVTPSRLGFRARIYGDHFKLDIRTANYHRGIERYVPASRAAWKHCLDDVHTRLDEALEQALKRLEERDLSWPRSLLVEGFGTDHPRLMQYPCLSTTEGTRCLANLLACQPIAWTSSRPSEALDLPLVILSTSEQQKLAQHYSGNWECYDERLARSAALRSFLQRPRHPLDPLALATISLSPPLEGTLQALARPQSKIVLLHRERWVSEFTFPVPGLCIHLECPEGWMSEDFSAATPPSGILEDLHRQACDFMADWMRLPRYHLGLPEWQALEEADPRLPECLLQQPWFPTNRGSMSWNDLLSLPRLCQAEEKRQSHESLESPVVLYTQGLPITLKERLTAQQPQLVSAEESGRWFSDWERRQKQRAELESLQRNWQTLKPRLSTERALLLWNRGSQKDFWRVHAGVRMPETRLPACVTGYIEVDEGGESGAEELAEVLEASLPLVEERLQEGPLSEPELQSMAEFCLVALPQGRAERLRELRWIPCHDGTLTSLQQLSLQGREQGAVEYWPRNYPSRPTPLPLPLLTSVLLQEMVRTCCEVEVRRHPAPWLYRSVGEVLREAVGWVRHRPGRRMIQALRGMWAGPAVSAESKEFGASLLAELQKSAQLLLVEPLARKASLQMLGNAQFTESRHLWKLDSRGRLSLNPGFPALQQAAAETRHLALLLSLVSAANTRSQEFTDDMEAQFLHQFVQEVVGAHR